MNAYLFIRNAALIAALGSIFSVSVSTAKPLGKTKDGTRYVPNEIQFALRAEFAAELSTTGPARRPVDKFRLQRMHRHIERIRGGHTAAERWLEGKALPTAIRFRGNDVPPIARSLTAILKEGVDAAAVLEEFTALPEIEWAGLVTAYRVSVVPNDPQYSLQWAPPLILAEEAWDVTPRTTGIDIAIVDTGVDLNHPDLQSIISYQRGFGDNATGNNLPVRADDTNNTASHGTHCAGIAAAIWNNSTGIAGIARGAQIMALGCARWDNDRKIYAITHTADAINDAIANGAEVINCSFGNGASSTLGIDMMWALDNARNNDVFVVCSAGNESDRIDPGKSWDSHDHPYIISATDSNDQLAIFRDAAGNRIGGSNWGIPIDLAAPGSGIVSTFVGTIGGMSGTSQAAPHVAGAAALLLSMNRDRIRAYGVKWLLERMATDIGAPGDDLNFGAGRLSLPGAMIRTFRAADMFVLNVPGAFEGDGNYESPFTSLPDALEASKSGDTLVLNGRAQIDVHSYPDAITIRSKVILTAFPDGRVLIGK